MTVQARGRIGRRTVVGLVGLVGGLALSGLLGVGCSEEEDKDRIEEVSGAIENIDLEKKTVMVRTYREKREKYETFAVEVTGDTEILINGALAKLADVKVGERAEGKIRIVRESSGMRFVALSVRIDRSEVLTAPGAKGAVGEAKDADSPGAGTSAHADVDTGGAPSSE